MEKIKENFVGKDLLQEIKTAEEIRAMFNIECDLSEEELKEYEEYQI